MKNDHKVISLRGILITAVCAIAAFTLTYGAFQVTYAAITAQSNEDTTSMEFAESDVTVSMNGVLEEGLPEGEHFVLGHEYEEVISAANNSSHECYLRVIVTKYWTDADGVKVLDVDPDTIQLGYNGDDYNTVAYKLDESSVTKEQAIYYCIGESGDLFNTLTVDGSLADAVTTETVDGVTTTTWDYGELVLHVDVEAQVVQSKGGDDAKLSAWGTVGA